MRIPQWKEQLSQLPSIACVAFATRCARRVQPLFLVSWPEAPQRLYQLLDGAIETVEEFTRGVDRTTSTFAFNAMSAVKAAAHANAPQAAVVASTVACATYALAAVGFGDFSATHAAQGADYAVQVFQFEPGKLTTEGLGMCVDAMKIDILRIEEGLKQGMVDTRKALPPDFLGPLWPHGEPPYVVQIPTLAT